MMWLPLVLSLAALFQPIAGFKVSIDPTSPLFRPTSLEDCLGASTNQPTRWKEIYNTCFTMFQKGNGDNREKLLSFPGKQVVDFSQVENLTPTKWQNGLQPSGTGIVMAKDDDVNAGVTSVYLHKRSDVNNESQGQEALDLDGKVDTNKEKRQWLGYSKKNHWLSVFRRAMLRTRRRHSLSINSALVSLADMMNAKDASRERERVRAFRQQLLGLGR